MYCTLLLVADVAFVKVKLTSIETSVPNWFNLITTWIQLFVVSYQSKSHKQLQQSVKCENTGTLAKFSKHRARVKFWSKRCWSFVRKVLKFDKTSPNVNRSARMTFLAMRTFSRQKASRKYWIKNKGKTTVTMERQKFGQKFVAYDKMVSNTATPV